MCYNGETLVSTLVLSFLIGIYSVLQVGRTTLTINFRTGLNIDPIRLRAAD